MPSVWTNKAIENVDLSGAEVYVEGRNIGCTLGECSYKYEANVKRYSAGYPSRLRGSEITSEKLTFSFGALELKPNNIILCSPSSFVTNETATIHGQTVDIDVIHLGNSTQPAVWSPVVLHKFNPANGKHYEFRLWRVQVYSGLTFSPAQDSSNFITLEVTMEAIADKANHASDPLGIVKISDDWVIS